MAQDQKTLLFSNPWQKQQTLMLKMSINLYQLFFCWLQQFVSWLFRLLWRILIQIEYCMSQNSSQIFMRRSFVASNIEIRCSQIVLVYGELREESINSRSLIRSGSYLKNSKTKNFAVILRLRYCLFGHFDSSTSNVHNLSMPLS